MYSVHMFILIVLFDTALMKVRKNVNDDVLYPCKNHEICEADMPGSKCLNNRCVCDLPEGCESMMNDESTVVRKIGLACEGDPDCLIDNSFCVLNVNGKGECRCVEGTVVSKDARICMHLTRGLNMGCEDNRQCSLIGGSECRKGLCKCKKGMKANYGACFYDKVLGDSCETNSECKAIQNGECFEKVCVCAKGFVMGLTGCLHTIRKISETCLEDVQCTWHLGDGAACLEAQCACRDTFTYKHEAQKCVQHLMLSRNCTRDKDCFNKKHEDSEYLTCKNHTCHCKAPSVEFEDDCVLAGVSITKSLLSMILSCLVYLCLF